MIKDLAFAIPVALVMICLPILAIESHQELWVSILSGFLSFTWGMLAIELMVDYEFRKGRK